MTVTGTLTIRYLKPVPLDQSLEAIAWVENVEGRKWNITGELRLSSSRAVLATASGIWVARDKSSHFAGFQQWLDEQDASARETQARADSATARRASG